VLKTGLEWNCASVKAKALVNLRSFLLEHNLTYLARPNLLVGYNLILDPRTQNLEKYDCALNWEVAPGATVGLRHDSTSKDSLSLGRILLNLHHNLPATNQVVGTEFVLDQ
jgi:hypothetical protein